jgi:hypothetical protein
VFTPSATTDINLVSLHETAHLLLSYILSYHLSLPVVRSSPAITQTNKFWTYLMGYLAGPLNVIPTAVYTNTYSYDKVCISKSRLTTLSLVQQLNSTVLFDITLYFKPIFLSSVNIILYLVYHNLFKLYHHKWNIYVFRKCSYLTGLCH